MPKHDLISIEDLSRADVELILDTAESFLPVLERDIKKVPTLRGRTIINLFWEASTRTSSSFDLAAKRLSADTLGLKASGSAVEKGETLKDTAITLSAYSPDIIVMRHPSAGACQTLSANTEASVINAGDGKHQHPTQCLLDLFSMRQNLGRDPRACASSSSATSCTAASRAATSWASGCSAWRSRSWVRPR